MSRLAQYTTYLSDRYCGGSSRKLIATWWCVLLVCSLTCVLSPHCVMVCLTILTIFNRYAILVLSGILLIMSLLVTSTRVFSEGFAALWSGTMLMFLSIGGTMIMRKFHNSFAVGFFMGSVVAMAQLFLLLFLV